jgi:periplasmic protein TonB
LTEERYAFDDTRSHRNPLPDVHAPVVVHRVEPLYPEEARRNHVSGVVIVQTVIDENGHVTEATALQGPPELTQAAVGAVKQWTWKPGTQAGKSVRVVFNLTVNFRLDSTPPAPVPY